MSNLNAISKCPNCHSNYLILGEDGNYTCQACDQVFSAAQIQGSSNSGVDSLASVKSAAVREIDSPDAALIYLETYFDSYDWETFSNIPNIYIDDLRVMVEKNKIKHPTDHRTWQLEAASIVYPVNKKIEAVEKLQKEIVEKYKGDIANVTKEFSVYNVLVGAIESNRDDIIRILDADLKNMKRFAAPAEDIASVEQSVASVKSQIVRYVSGSEIEELPAIKDLMKANENKVVGEYAALGINAPDCYDNALAEYNNGNLTSAVELFKRVREYRDAEKYISMINTHFFFGQIFEAGGKIYKVEPHKDIIPTKGCKDGCKNLSKKDQQAEDDQPDIQTYDFHEIVDQVPSKKPAFGDASRIVCAYGDNIYYIKKADKLCVFNTKSETETVLDTSKYGYNLDDGNSSGLVSTKDKFYLRKILEIKELKKGCLTFNFKNKLEEYRKSQQNNYAMLLVDLANATANLAIEKMVDNICVGDLVFFKVSEVVSEDKHHHKTYENKVKMHSFITGKTDVLFSKNCEIIAVNGNKVVYDFWDPNSLNRELHVIDYITHEDALIESNVYQYIKTTDSKLVYTVGNRTYASLFSIDLDGKNRLELMPKFSKSMWSGIVSSDNWIYMLHQRPGQDCYSVYKLSAETGDSLFLAFDVKSIIKIAGSYVYYLSKNNEFRMVGFDGNNNRTITTDLSGSENVSVGVSQIFYARGENVGDRKYSKSLYKMDANGHNAYKVLFDIEAMKDKNAAVASSDIYVLKKEKKYFKVTFSKLGKKPKELVAIADIDTYYAFNKATGERRTLLVLGTPTAETYTKLAGKSWKTLITGCKLFNKGKQITIEEIELEIDYGQIADDEGEAYGLMSAEAALKKMLKKKGCSGKKNDGEGDSSKGSGCAGNQKPAKGCGCGTKKTKGCGCI